MTPGAARQRGFALLIVLWTVALLSLLITQLGATSRSAAQQARNLRLNAVAETAADAAVQQAVFHLMDTSNGHWAADGTTRQLRLPAAVATLRIDSEAGKINPNTAQVTLLQALLRNVGADERSAVSIAAAIVDWRLPTAQAQPFGALAPQYRAAGKEYGPPGAPFRSVDEVGLVLGMSPALMERLKPYLTVTHDRQPDPRSASRLVLQSLRDTDPSLAVAQSARRDESVVQITASVAVEGGASFTRRAIIRLGQSADKALYQVLVWDRESG